MQKTVLELTKVGHREGAELRARCNAREPGLAIRGVTQRVHGTQEGLQGHTCGHVSERHLAEGVHNALLDNLKEAN